MLGTFIERFYLALGIVGRGEGSYFCSLLRLILNNPTTSSLGFLCIGSATHHPLYNMSSSLFYMTPPVHAQEVPLSSLRAGDRGQIARIDAPELEIALLKMGVTIGDQLAFAVAAPLGGPIAVRAMHTKLSLRREDAMHIWINRR
jgi:ferrous iron transport protein A